MIGPLFRPTNDQTAIDLQTAGKYLCDVKMFIAELRINWELHRHTYLKMKPKSNYKSFNIKIPKDAKTIAHPWSTNRQVKFPDK